VKQRHLRLLILGGLALTRWGLPLTGDLNNFGKDDSGSNDDGRVCAFCIALRTLP
jgi:hypothetical protein